jgi:hypothetical protein
VFRRDDLVYVLLAEPWDAPNGETYIEDVVVWLGPDGTEVGRWAEHDHLDATIAPGGAFWADTWPGSIDAWHTNGLFVEENGDLLLTLKTASTLLSVSAANWRIEWVFAGDGVGSALPTDVTFVPTGVGDPRFGEMHHPARQPNGNLTVFDNLNVRGLELALDEAARTASFVAHWPLIGLQCPNQSSVFQLAGGHHVVGCAGASVIVEFDLDGFEVARWDLECPQGSTPLMVRAQPLDLWSAQSLEVTVRRR